jgi:hypothetical protein
MAMFLCRWPNGDFSIVSAATKADAIEMLDELGNAEYAKVMSMPECMFDFRLNDLGEIELAQIGENTEEFVMEKCYPELGKVLLDAETDENESYTPTALEQIRGAVEHERKRLLQSHPEPAQADTQLGRDLQREMDLPSEVANRIVRRTAKEILRSKKGEGGKVQ